MTEKKGTAITVRTTKSIESYIEELCKDSGESKTNLIKRLIIEAYINLKKVKL